jgi:hypothetical protein
VTGAIIRIDESPDDVELVPPAGSRGPLERQVFL